MCKGTIFYDKLFFLFYFWIVEILSSKELGSIRGFYKNKSVPLWKKRE